MTANTLVQPRRDPTMTVLALVAVVLLVAAVAAALAWPGKVIVIDVVDKHTATTLVPIESVGLIAPACATVDAVAFPCTTPQMVAVQS